MFMVLAKTAQEMKHTENVICLISGAVILTICAIYLAFFIEKRVDAHEAKQRLVELRRLQERKNEIVRESEGFRQIDIELKRENERLRKENERLLKDNENYKQQLDEIELGTFSGRSLKHG